MGIMRQNNSIGIYLLFVVIFYSCTQSVVFSEYQPLEDAKWKANESISLSFSIRDTISPKNLFINIRNTNDYAFSNLYVITELTFPDGLRIVDTLQYEMADEQGRFLGKGSSSIKENKLFYKENKIFPQAGDYQFKIRQAMRKSGEVEPMDFLEGIQEVGLSIEKIEQP